MQQLEKILRSVPYLETLDIRVEEAKPGLAVLRLPSRDAVQGHGGTVHTGAIFGIGEVAAGVAVGTHPELASRPHLAQRSGVRYIAAASGDVTAHARVTPEMVDAVKRQLEEKGQATLDVSARIMDGHGTDVAEVVAVFAFRA